MWVNFSGRMYLPDEELPSDFDPRDWLASWIREVSSVTRSTDQLMEALDIKVEVDCDKGY